VKPSISSPFGFLFILFVACTALYTGLWWGHSFSTACLADASPAATHAPDAAKPSDMATTDAATGDSKPSEPPAATAPAATPAVPATAAATMASPVCTPLNKLFAWAFDFKISDFFLILFTGLLAFKVSGLDKATRALQVLGTDQAKDTKEAIALAREATQTAHDQVSLSRQATVDANRAFVFIEKVEWKALFVNVNGVKKLSWGFIVHWRNSGTTPTRRMQSCVYDTVFVYKKLLEDFAYPDNRGHEDLVIFPRATMHSRPLRIDPEYFALAQSGHAEIFIWGWADYDDFFEGTPRRRVEFCLAVEAIGDPKSAECKFVFHKHGPFNGHDGDCHREPQPYRIAPQQEKAITEATLKSA